MNRRLLLPLFLLFAATSAAHAQGGNTLTLRFAGVPSGTCAPFMLGINNATGGEYNCTSGGAWNLIGGGGGAGTVTSVSFTGGLISVANPTTTPAFTVAGTSGGIPFFDSATTWSTSAALSANRVVLGGGAGVAPTVTSADSTTTHALFATAGAPAFRALAAGDIPSGAVTWDLLGNPAGNLALTMAGNTSTFNTTTANATFFNWKNTTAAVVGTSQGSPLLNLCGRAFHGSADVEDCLTLKELPGNGNDAAVTFTVGHTGTSTGAVTTVFPGPIQPGSDGTQAAPVLARFNGPTAGLYFVGTNLAYSAGNTDTMQITGNPAMRGASNFAYTWGSTTSGTAQDTGISRDAAAVVDIGSGAAGDTTGKVKAAGYMSVGTKFTTDTGCGTVTTLVGGATAGSFVANTTGACTVVITMGNSATAPNGWICSPSDRTTGNLFRQSASSTTTCTVTGTAVSGDVISFAAIGY